MDLNDGRLLRIFIGEQDRHGDEPMHQWLVSEAHRQGIAGATVLRGLEGYGADGSLHTARVLRLSTDLPLVVEMVDSVSKIDAFLAVVDEALQRGLVTVEKVEMKFYRRDSD